MTHNRIKRWSALLIAALLMGSVASAEAPAVSQGSETSESASLSQAYIAYGVTQQRVNIYDEPRGALLGSIPEGTEVGVLRTEGEWALIETEEEQAWCAYDTLSITETPDADESATETTSVMPLSAADVFVAERMDSAAGNATKEDFETDSESASHYVNFYMEGTQSMQGIFSTVSRYIRIPDYATVSDAVLCVSYTSSDLILQENSSLTFYLNSTAFYSCRLSGSSSKETVLYIRVPAELFQEDYNLLEISGYVRLTDDEGCTDDYNGANWVNIADTTCLRVGYDLIDDQNELRYYPYPFLSLEDDTGDDFTVAVSDAADESELTAAALVMADMGAEVSGENGITLARIGAAQDHHIVYFGLAENTPDELLSLLGAEVPASGALLKRVTSGGKEYLLVVSKEADALVEAARFLNDGTRVKQVSADTWHISVGESETFLLNATANTLQIKNSYTFKEFLGHGISLTGPFHQEVTVTLPVSRDYTLSGEGKFVIKMRYSANLDFDRSLMSVYWGDSRVPLISSKLTAEEASGHTLSFSVPADAVGTAGNTMVIAFELEVKDLDCTPRQLDMPWAYISEASTVFLPEGEGARLSLSSWPAPFQRQGSLNDVMVVLSDSPGEDELALMGSTMLAIGSGTNAYGALKVIYGSEFDAGDAEYNIIALGYGARNAIFAGLNEHLFFHYNADLSRFLSNDKLILADDYARTLGSIQLLDSPYAGGYALLAVTAPEESGIRQLIEVMNTPRLRWKFDREAAIVDPDLEVETYYFTAESAIEEERPSTILETLSKNREPMLFALIGMGAMLLLLVGVIIVLINIRRHGKNDE